MKGSMIKETLKKFFSYNIIQVQINFLFITFIFLFGLKYDYFQFRFLILILLIPCGLKLIKECFNKNFKNIILFLFFLVVLISHSLINIYYENTNITNYNFFGIILLTSIFVISFYFYENFNKNIQNIIKLFLLLFFGSVLLSFFNFEPDVPFFCGGIPDIFGILNSYEEFIPDNMHRIADKRFSFKEYLFPENSHLGMIAPSIIIYLVHLNFTTKVSKFFKFITYLFILLCLIKSSTTLLLGTIISLILLISVNFKNIPKNTLIAFSTIIIIFSLILISSKECRSRFVPIYSPDFSGVESIVKDSKEIETVGEVNIEFASKLKNIMGTMGSLSSGVYFHALMIAKKSIIEKPFGWGLNRYDIAFEYFTQKSPSKIQKVNFLNSKDGANNFIKLIVELGVFALIIYLFFFLFFINKNIPLEYKFFYLPFVITQSLRGAGYFNGGFSLIVFIMLLTYLKLNKKKL